ncbi:bifunctional hydroxymethylpyrimidine kinase/phosphomethylpyrimidine kinase [Desulfovibrionales bacterium]
MHPSTYARVVTIAGSDSGGGAGIQADLKTIAAHGCYGASIITALTAQNTLGVTAIHPVPTDFVAAQMDAVFGDIGADAVKIGMLFSPELIHAVAQGLQRHNVHNIVVDPVMVAQSGDRLVQDEAIAALTAELIPRAFLITPNLPEAQVLLDRAINTRDEIAAAAYDLAALGAKNVLLKGGHGTGEESEDCLFLGPEQRTVFLRAPRSATRNNHGTGCTLSSAIAAQLALGKNMEEATQLAKTYITGAIMAGARHKLGQGHGPVHHFFRFFS